MSASLTREIPNRERSISERYRLAGDIWVTAKAKSDLADEHKTIIFAQIKTDLLAADPKLSETKAERLARITDQWSEFVSSMVELRRAANKARHDLACIEMEFREWQSRNASARAEMGMGGR